MTSRGGGHARAPGPSSPRPAAAPRLQVQRSQSRETVTVHFSALGKEEEEEEEELYAVAATSLQGAEAEFEDQSVVTAEEASEDLFEGRGLDSVSVAVELSESSSIPTPVPSLHQAASHAPSPAPSSSSHPASSSSSPSRTPPSKPFMSLVKSLSVEVEPREGMPAPPTMRHRHLMRTLVKSLSTDASRQDPEPAPHRGTDHSRLNLQLFKQFAQPRITATAAATVAGDSKTAPSSPLTSPDGRSFFKVQEVEARLEDTRRRLSEVMYEPLQLLSKFIGDEGGASGGPAHRPKALSSSASELTSLAGLNGHLESNNNYSIKEEEDCSEGEGEGSPGGSASKAGSPWSPGSPRSARSPPLALERCSMLALARQEDEEFYELHSEDFDVREDGDGDGRGAVARRPRLPQEESGMEMEEEIEEETPSVPHWTLFVLTTLLYGCFVLPLPAYVSAVLMGVAAGFMLAMLFVWLAAPRRGSARGRGKAELWNVAHLDIQEPGIFKGWMNEICNYDPETYHATLTHSVFVRLEGSTLRLSRPNRNIARRASFNEPKPDVTYVSQKIYDLTDSKISLVPQSLARKRVWNKKYPIRIELGRQDDFMSKTQPGKGGAEDDKVGAGERGEALGGAEEPRRSCGMPEQGRGPASREQILFLFGRTGREKEEWFRRISLASKLKSENRKPSSLPGSRSAFLPSHSRSSSQSGGLSHSRSSSRSSLDELLMMSQPRQKELTSSVKQKMLLDYSVYMAKYVPPQPGSPCNSPINSAESSPGASKKLPSSPREEAEPEAWVNALLGRIFWDFLGEKYWANMVSKKIQMKLSKIRLPYFMNELTLTELDMGVAIPKILQASKPSVDHQGLWFDLDISYNGSFLMTLETKMNLARLGKEGEGLRFGEAGKDGPRPRTYCLADSDEESSSAGSSDEEDPPEIPAEKNLLPGAEGYVGGHRPSKIMRFVDKITKSKYFQKATETEFIKKKMEEVSNTPLLLTVEVQECCGKLAVNIPPPPTDRIWYGFRTPPHLELKARPKLGEREVTLVHVTDWIEKKLEQEFQKIFVMPNMDDVWLPIMHSAMDARSNASSVAMTTDTPKELEGPTQSDM
ncbi:testis-expressed protein 2-like isoform X1 [Megalops cyprinoides]|uniref:testis-expressed protein 2-like isoform X1 n=1 Tax=Megalops cyprinoides TaxID=118141 RepID=UPI00186415DF|nr:testis-expressed protein 2-like isoform X1 [Megalops cyprinoides]XP_036408183.1 testis-expressed protein 2-like isoform X1 [Megalops cyprinoides]XP_036408184.1 testis-expressed protein 2-like isoform X1 [Megalops cyprinoides]XP_036408185.1 testis-expressed protein 2-like isoform X1 [Megalops cyprinoides]XP_036408186.1 testis-expressed protein 2-like isoform X1 [Megalops cyprinoides]XP_036408187.1 testis-expressed protein 2-like isoform X1 [Megalops cyprinoides]